MKTYQAKQLLEVGAGSVLRLDPAQAKRRAPKIQAVAGRGQHIYRASVPVQFKAGERFGLEGDLPKAHQALAELVDGDPEATVPGGEPKPEEKPAETKPAEKRGFLGRAKDAVGLGK